jgi:hypothetical protein
MPVIPVLKTMMREDQEFKSNLDTMSQNTHTKKT